jgi:pimeloyl-ACP methyl ester carboxylesterase
MAYEQVFDHRLFYRQKGAEGPAVVFIHGVPTSSHQWRPVQHLTSRYLTTYSIDLLGMGQSDKPLEGWDYTFQNDARILEALMERWGHEKMVIVGDDWGGGIALTFAATYPERTDLCVWMNSTTYEQWPVAEIETIARMSAADDEEFERFAGQFPMFLAILLRGMVHRHANITARDMRAFREAYETVDYSKGGSLLAGDAGYGTPDIEGIRALALRAASLDPGWMLELPYENITAPSMGLWGRDDIYMDAVDLYRFKRDMKNATVRLQTIPEAGHLAMVDQPHVVADAILDFITEHRGTGALAQPYDGFPEVLGAQHVSDDFRGFWPEHDA